MNLISTRYSNYYLIRRRQKVNYDFSNSTSVNQQARHWQWHAPGCPPKVSVPTHHFFPFPSQLEKTSVLCSTLASYCRPYRKDACRRDESYRKASCRVYQCIVWKNINTQMLKIARHRLPWTLPGWSDNYARKPSAIPKQKWLKSTVRISLTS